MEHLLLAIVNEHYPFQRMKICSLQIDEYGEVDLDGLPGPTNKQSNREDQDPFIEKTYKLVTFNELTPYRVEKKLTPAGTLTEDNERWKI